jgi:hypothetical protein
MAPASRPSARPIPATTSRTRGRRRHIDVVIDDLFLLPNRYYLSLWISTRNQWFDILDHCIAIDVEASNAHDNQGRGMHSKWGLVYMRSRWELGPPAVVR